MTTPVETALANLTAAKSALANQISVGATDYVSVSAYSGAVVSNQTDYNGVVLEALIAAKSTLTTDIAASASPTTITADRAAVVATQTTYATGLLDMIAETKFQLDTDIAAVQASIAVGGTADYSNVELDRTAYVAAQAAYSAWLLSNLNDAEAVLAADIASGASSTVIAADQAAVTAAQATMQINSCTATYDSTDYTPTVAYQEPTIYLTVTATPQTYSAVGDIITFNYYTAFEFDLSGVTITDDRSGLSASPIILDSSSTVAGVDTTDPTTWYASSNLNYIGSSTYTITADDISGTGLAIPGSTTTNPDGTTTSTPGQLNASNFNLTANTVASAAIGAIGIDSTASTGNVILAVQAAVVTNGAVQRLDFSSPTVTVIPVGSVLGSSVKASSNDSINEYASVGDVIVYSLAVSNTGTVPLDIKMVNSDLGTQDLPLLASTSGVLTLQLTVTQAMIDKGEAVKTLTILVQGNLDGGNAPTVLPGGVYNPTTGYTAVDLVATAFAAQSPALSISGSVSPSAFALVSQVINYQLTVANAGNVTLQSVIKVKDSNGNDCTSLFAFDVNSPITLSPVGTNFVNIYGFYAHYTVTANDVAAGTLDYIFYAEGTNDTCMTVTSSSLNMSIGTNKPKVKQQPSPSLPPLLLPAKLQLPLPTKTLAKSAVQQKVSIPVPTPVRQQNHKEGKSEEKPTTVLPPKAAASSVLVPAKPKVAPVPVPTKPVPAKVAPVSTKPKAVPVPIPVPATAKVTPVPATAQVLATAKVTPAPVPVTVQVPAAAKGGLGALFNPSQKPYTGMPVGSSQPSFNIVSRTLRR